MGDSLYIHTYIVDSAATKHFTQQTLNILYFSLKLFSKHSKHLINVISL